VRNVIYQPPVCRKRPAFHTHFADTGVADEEELEEIVVLAGVHDERESFDGERG
jgi:hypothetical protein